MENTVSVKVSIARSEVERLHPEYKEFLIYATAKIVEDALEDEGLDISLYEVTYE